MFILYSATLVGLGILAGIAATIAYETIFGPERVAEDTSPISIRQWSKHGPRIVMEFSREHDDYVTLCVEYLLSARFMIVATYPWQVGGHYYHWRDRELNGPSLELCGLSETEEKLVFVEVDHYFETRWAK